jgi:MoxR-like ATPase
MGSGVASPAAPAMDDKKVAAIVASAVQAKLDALRTAAADANKPQVIEVQHEKGKVTKAEGEHYLMPRVLRLIRAGFHVYLWGDAGTGKTTALMHAAKLLKMDSEIDTLDPSTFRSMIQGFISADGKTHVATAFTRCWEKGKLYIADETDNAPGHVQTLFNSALANRFAPLAWGNIEQTDGFAFSGTGNTPGRPTRQFPDRKPMSAAFADRLYFVHWPLDPAIEARAGGLPTPEKPVTIAAQSVTPQQWVTYVQRLRAWASVQCPTLMITPRASLAGLAALKVGESPMDVADALIFRGADQDIKGKAHNAVRLV